MKKILVISIALFTLACKKDSISLGSKIVKVTVDGKIDQSFVYSADNKLARINDYGMCTTTPRDEYVYTYKDNRLEKTTSILRSYYSSLASMCDPSKGEVVEQVYVYDNSGKIVKVVGPNATTEYIYNQEGFISKKLLGGGSNKFYEYFYDARGNVIKEIGPEGDVTEYEYDSAPNPFYQHRPGAINPFSMSPNNIIKATGSRNYVRTFEYKSNVPVKVLEDNGQTYIYHYQ